MKKPYAAYAMTMECLLLGLSLPLTILCSVSLAQPPITPSGLNTQVSLAPAPPPGKVQYDITGGTRPGGGLNLFHSFGDFNVPNNNIANFLNDSGLATSNILGRVTGGNISNIFGTIQTTNFNNANLFLMNPAGFLFGPNATVNVGGMVSFTSADYLRLADGARFNAVPNATADALLSAAPVAAFGFLGSNPGAITVQGSQLSVAEGTGISLVGGNITMQSGTLDNGTVQSAQLSAPSGQINVVSVGRPSNPHVAGEVVIAGPGAGYTPSGFATLGTISLSQGSTVDTSPASSPTAGTVLIRGGQLVMDASSIVAGTQSSTQPFSAGGTIEVTADQVTLSNHSGVDASQVHGSSPGNITFNVGTFSATDSGTSAALFNTSSPSGAVTIQGLQGAGTSAHSVSLTNAGVSTENWGLPSPPPFNITDGGPILIRADNITLNQTNLSAFSFEGVGGAISLLSKGGLDIRNSSLNSATHFIAKPGATIDLRAGSGISLTNTNVDAHSHNFTGGTITMAAPLISISGTTLEVWGGGGQGAGGTISLTATKGVSLTNGTVLSADNVRDIPPGGFWPAANGGTILINGGAKFTAENSTLSATSILGNGGTIQVQANKVSLTDTQLTTSVPGGPQTVGGSITIDAKNTTLTNSQILSTATEGTGGTIDITSPVLHQAGSVIDASSQFGTDGTVTINGIIQP